MQTVVTYTAVISAPNPDLLLLPGMTALLRIVVSETGMILKVPNEALRFRPPRTGAGSSVPGPVSVVVDGSHPDVLSVPVVPAGDERPVGS